MIFKGLYYIVTILLMFLRNFGHFICYITAPLAIIFFLSEKSSFITVSFFKRFLALCLWPVFISAIYLVVSTITSPNFKIGGELNIFESVAYLLIFSLLLTVVPLFASQFVSGLWGVAEAGFMQRVFSLIPMTGFLTPIKGVTSLATSATNHSKSFAKDKFLKTPTYNGIKRTHERLKHTKLGENKAYQSMHKNLERAFKPKKIVEAENQAERIKEKQFQKKLNYLLTKNLGRKT